MTYMNKFATGALAITSAVALTSAAHAASIVGLYNTGVDNTGTVVANGSTDSHYSITSNDNALPIPTGAYVVKNHPSWVPNSAVGASGPAASAWLSPFIDPATLLPANSKCINNATGGPFATCYYDYTITFDIGGRSSGSLSGEIAADNYTQIYLNGNLIDVQAHAPYPGSTGGTPSYFNEWNVFSDSTHFVAGVNTLTFKVTDVRPNIVTGLNVRNLIGTAVPEPATWGMMLLGFGMVASQMRRRRRTMAVVSA